MSLTIKDLPEEEKPRERALHSGLSSLSDAELLAILLRTGTRGKNAKDVAIDILKETNHLENIEDITPKQMASLNGVGLAKALTILSGIELGKRVWKREISMRTRIENAQDIYHLLLPDLKYAKQENLVAVFLDNKKRVICHKTIFVGTSNVSIVHAREIFHEAIKYSAVFIILAHNHPSGDPAPSKADVHLTNQIKKCSELLDIPLLDHIILGKNTYYSFYDHEWGA